MLAREGYLQGNDAPFRNRPYHPNIGPGLKELYTIARPPGMVSPGALPINYLDNTTFIDRMYNEGINGQSIQPEWEDYIQYYPYEDTAGDGNDLLQVHAIPFRHYNVPSPCLFLKTHRHLYRHPFHV